MIANQLVTVIDEYVKSGAAERVTNERTNDTTG